MKENKINVLIKKQKNAKKKAKYVIPILEDVLQN